MVLYQQLTSWVLNHRPTRGLVISGGVDRLCKLRSQLTCVQGYVLQRWYLYIWYVGMELKRNRKNTEDKILRKRAEDKEET